MTKTSSISAQNTTEQQAVSELITSLSHIVKYYANVHRGSGYNSIITTALYEKAKDMVLEYLQMDKNQNEVIFCTPYVVKELSATFKFGSYKTLSSAEIGLPLGIRALVVRKSSLPKGAPLFAGGGTARLTAPGWVVWEKGADKFEAGTPSVFNAIVFAKALQFIKTYGVVAFGEHNACKIPAGELLYHDNLVNLAGLELISALRAKHNSAGKVPMVSGNHNFVYFDHAASNPPLYPVWDTYCRVLEHCQDDEDMICETRKICSEFLNAPLEEYDIIFTSNTTEGINIASRYLDARADGIVVTSLLEHTSNDLPWRINSRSIIRLNIDSIGLVDLSELESLLIEYNENKVHGNSRIGVVSISGASNVLGIYNDLKQIGEVVHRYGAVFMTDAAQMAAHHEIDMKGNGIDCLAFSGHKVYAPFGTGILAARKGLLKVNQEIFQSGEENIAGIAALGKAMVLLKRIGFEAIRKEELALTSFALKAMSNIKGIEIYGVQHTDSQNFSKKGAVIAFTLKGIMPHELGNKLEACGIGFRFGCHCSHILVKHILNVPPALQKFQWILAHTFPKLKFPGVDRISFGILNTREEVEYFISVLELISRNPKQVRHQEFKAEMKKFTAGIINDF